ncbi:MAG: hypothetical protein RMY34_18130 [Aulosira sp. DedQUE10]|nr:hypothetical protein [Aulosira sp. DedQUE10]
MYTKNQELVTTVSLIAELTDADLANYVGSCGYINPGGRKLLLTMVQ